MTTFTDRWRQLNWDDIALRINSKTQADVERALQARHLSRDDMMVSALRRRAPFLSRWPSALRGSPASVLATR